MDQRIGVIGRGRRRGQHRAKGRVKHPWDIVAGVLTQPAGYLLEVNRHCDRIGKARLIKRDEGVDRALDDGRFRIAGDRGIPDGIDD